MKTLWLAVAFLMLGCSRGEIYSRKGVAYSVSLDEDLAEPVQPDYEDDNSDQVGGVLIDSPDDDVESSESSDTVKSGAYVIPERDSQPTFQEYLDLLTENDRKEELETRSASRPGDYFHCYGSPIQGNQFGQFLGNDQYLEGIAPIQGLYQSSCNPRSPSIPHESSCGCYIGCPSGYPQLLRCRDGYLYEYLSRTCLPAREVRNCGGSVAPPRPPPHQIFPPVPKPTPFPEPDVVPSLRCPAPSGLFPHPTNCRLYLNCDRGTPHIQTCGPRTVFSKKLRVCVHPNKEDCDAAGQVINGRPQSPWDFEAENIPSNNGIPSRDQQQQNGWRLPVDQLPANDWP